MRIKKRARISYGSVGDIAPRKLGDLRMRAIAGAAGLNITFLHEELPPDGAAPKATIS